MQHEYTIGFFELPAASEAVARSMLRMVAPMLGRGWELVQGIEADVIIVPLPALPKAHAACAQGTFFLALSNGSSDEAGAGIGAAAHADAQAVLRRPIRPDDLLQALSAASNRLQALREGGQPQPQDHAAGLTADGLAALGPAVDLRTALREQLIAPRPASFLLHEGQAIHFGMQGFACTSGRAGLARMLRAGATATPVIPWNDARDEFARSELHWCYWITERNGRLRRHLDACVSFRLRHFPDLGSLPHYRADVRLATLLMNDAWSLERLAQHAGVRLQTAANFLNAADALGLLEGLQTAAAHQAPRGETSSARQSLVARLRGKLGLLHFGSR